MGPEIVGVTYRFGDGTVCEEHLEDGAIQRVTLRGPEGRAAEYRVTDEGDLTPEVTDQDEPYIQEMLMYGAEEEGEGEERDE